MQLQQLSSHSRPLFPLSNLGNRGFFIAKSQTNQHPQCKFIARYQWLKQQLNFDIKRLPTQPCPKFDAWLEQLQPAGLTLIFPTAYLNNPSSILNSIGDFNIVERHLFG